MITIKFDKYSVTIKGHSGYAEEGKDIVCSAVSALTYTLARAILERETKAKDIVTDLDKGDGKISCEPLPKYKLEFWNLFDDFRHGFEMIANQYPEYIEVIA